MLVFTSCSEKKIYTKSDMWEMGRAEDPNLELILPKDIASGVQCSAYGSGCISGVVVRVMKMDMIFVEYQSAEQALAFAKTIDAYVVKNWVIDDVVGEPMLEKFVEKAFAKDIQRVRRPSEDSTSKAQDP